MKQFLLILTGLLFIATLTSHSQEIIITYSYDAAGNRINRRDTIFVGGGGKGAADSEDPFKKDVVNDDTFTPTTIKIYPNPTKGNIEIEIPDNPDSQEEKIRIVVLDINGRKLLDKNKQSLKTNVDLSSQPDGIYLLNLIKGNVVSQWKIIKR
jgi:hypothetical protein